MSKKVSTVNMKVPNAIIYTLFDHYFGVHRKQEHMNTHPKQNKIENDDLFPNQLELQLFAAAWSFKQATYQFSIL